ncbi:aminopeptidase N [Massilia sp. TWP1-3-3]|uniref:aminopeptidase N n=1 Tax=Massilia sp. TWP1-3-3 TaxID=2804573 RepID=UPI003CF213E2
MSRPVPRVLTLAAIVGSLFALAAVAPAAAAPAAKIAAAAAPRAENAYLTREEAMKRSARVSNVAYTLAFELTGKETFGGTSTIAFDLKDASAPLTIDLNKGTISALTVNGKAVTPQYNNWFITVAAKDLVAGRNTVSVTYTRSHSTNGEGLHRMQDPLDGKVYTYSHFEPAAANQMFALFDQPNLKATYALTVTAPADWTVISTKRETKIDDQGATRRWTFPATKKLSSYNFSLHAGPYKVWEDNSGTYPMRLFARQSLAGQIPADVWFKYTKAGLAYFDGYFGVPYAFEKYDTILVPDFLYGAMENAGAITFAERGFVYKSAMTSGEREKLAEVILHEMAHQWFGDLVTMDWWNGLWLNESFASFMATLALGESTEFKNAWQSFYISDKQSAYVQDTGPSSHPIEVAVPSTANAFDNIDAITYSKGASTLKQLRHLLGEEAFRKGVHNYLVKYQFKNAKLDDFIGELGKAAGRDLGPWKQQWLYTEGVNTIAADFTCSGGKIASFNLRQLPAGAGKPATLREQRVQVATFAMKNGKLVLDKKVPVTYKGASTPIKALIGGACPDLVYPNYEDWGFAMVELDAASFATAGKVLGKVDDTLLRTMLWQSLWDGVRAAKYPLNDFMQTAMDNVGAEKDYTLLGEAIGRISNGAYYLKAMPAPAAYAAKTMTQLQQIAWKGIEENSGNLDFARRWFRLYQDVATDKAGLDKLASILSGETVIQGMPLNQDLRWSLITTLNRYDYPNSAALIPAELARDKSDSGQTAALRASVMRPDAAVKAEWLAKIEDVKTSTPFPRLRAAMGSMYPVEQAALAEASAEQRLAKLPAIDKAADPVFMRSYGGSMIPANCTAANVARLDKVIAQNKNLSAGIMRALKDTHEHEVRCVAIKKAMTVR